jgi:hypothetical protein
MARARTHVGILTAALILLPAISALESSESAAPDAKRRPGAVLVIASADALKDAFVKGSGQEQSQQTVQLLTNVLDTLR